MRKYTFGMIALFGLALSLAMSPVRAQAADAMVIDVPFEFRVGHETLPAGRYLVGRLSPTSTCVVVSNAEHGPSAAAITAGTIQPSRKTYAPRVVFKELGGIHILSEVWAQGGGSGVEVSISHHDKALTQGKTVVVLAR